VADPDDGCGPAALRSSVQFFTREELEAVKASDLSKLLTGEAFLHVTGAAAARVRLPLAVDPFTKTPRFGARKEAEHQALQDRHPAFATLAQIQAERQALVTALVEHLYALTDLAEACPPSPLLALEAGKGARRGTLDLPTTPQHDYAPGPADAF
jgi:hypothetical protein